MNTNTFSQYPTVPERADLMESKQFSHRLPGSLSQRIYSYIEQHESLSPNVSANMQDFRKNIFPPVWRKQEGFTDRVLCYEILGDLSALTDIPLKTLVEICIKENENIPINTHTVTKSPEWVKLHYPTKEMRELALMLDNTSAHNREIVLKYTNSLLPKSFNDFWDAMHTDAGELSASDIENGSEGMRDELKIENYSDRIYYTLKFVLFNKLPLRARLKEVGLDIDYRRYRHPCHFWAYKLEDLQAYCDFAEISPHWFFLGNSERKLLAENSITETILDRFGFLTKGNKSLLAYSIKALCLESSE